MTANFPAPACYQQAGIADRYINAYGQEQAIPQDIQERLFTAMAPNQAQQQTGPIPTVQVFIKQPDAYQVPCQLPHTTWCLMLENGETLQGVTTPEQPAIVLDPSLPLGYHHLVVTADEQHYSCRIIIAPQRCFEPDLIQAGHKVWGATIQLYTLRSATNWGIGDFGDLISCIREVAKRGGHFVGLNPIHALYLNNPEAASPYSPSSRRWLNVIYIDVDQVPEFHHSQPAQTWWHSPETQQKLVNARQSDWVDYRTVTELKLAALQYAYQAFTMLPIDHPRRTDFLYFVTQGGESLQQQAAFDALQQQLTQQDDLTQWGWPVWPTAYQDYHNEAVTEFRQQHASHIEFYTWLQWLAHEQLANCYQLCQELNMTIGLYRDLAVGVAEGGAETWGDQDGLYAMQASVGAPPDVLGPLGQNWGLPPMNPHVLTQLAYQPFVELLRANMQHCGALRIDHVMSLLRLWWIPYGDTANNGAYVAYPMDDLLAILALESQRAQCLVIGEDLGIVPPEITGKLSDSGIYSYKVLYFEQQDPQQFRPPAAYLPQAMATLTTHDLPTLAGYWQLGDLILGEQLGLYRDPVILKQLMSERQQSKQALLNGLYTEQCLTEAQKTYQSHEKMGETLNFALHQYIAMSQSALVGLQLEDWLMMESPVNIPGLVEQYPMWRRKLSNSLESLFTDPQVNSLLEMVNQTRNQTSN